MRSSDFDLVGFGSGISFGKHYKDLLDFADKLPAVTDKKAFIFSTSGQTGKTNKFHQKLREALEVQRFHHCSESLTVLGFDTYGAPQNFRWYTKGAS